MHFKIIIVTKKENSLLNHLIVELEKSNFNDFLIMTAQNQLNQLENENFKFVFIYCLVPLELNKWRQYIEDRFFNSYKIYFFNELVEEQIWSSVFLNFDYIIAGECESKVLTRLLEFLQKNYWRKIPLNFNGLTKEHRSRTLVEILRIIERTDLNTLTISQIAKQLNLNRKIINKELHDKFKMNFINLKLQLLDYYRRNYPTECT